ncbi:hypothetical protein PC39_06079 [Salinisphaera sp. PC39]|uniref:hypothetical protein n=1 Tax=Salinisphaera sp. PC39 TaxID=1304156 RepID=UPI003340EA62
MRWIEPDGYATRAFAGGDPAWMAEPQTAVSTLAQANSALGSRVLSVDMLPAFLAAAAVEAGDPLDVADAVLSDEAGLANAQAVAKAAEHTLAGQVELVLRLPSPYALLRRFAENGVFSPSFDDLDDAAMLLANAVRGFADFNFAGLLLATDVDEDHAEDEFAALDSVLGTVRHYRWLSLLRLDGDLDPSSSAAADVDVILLPHRRPAVFHEDCGLEGRRVGGGLSAEFWEGADFGTVSPDTLYYGDAPADIEPEAVLARVRTLP